KGIGGATALALATRGTGLAGAQVATPMASPAAVDYPELLVTAVDDAFGLPSRTQGGWTRITLRNAGTPEHHAMFMRLNDGVTADDFTKAAQGPDLGALFGMSTSIGGPGSISAGEEASVILDLKPGNYVVICTIPNPDGTPHYQMGMLQPLTVSAAAQALPEPTADGAVALLDFHFMGIPETVAAGPHVWKVTNPGKQPHELMVARLAPGLDVQTIMGMLEAPPASPAAGMATPMAEASPMAGAPPFVGVAGVAPMSPGETNWMPFDLEAGDYLALCFVPDPATGKPHFALGMVMPFTIG
ncbi:MAG TPA: hypothetical protein VFI22_07570, partial [Thermomicrobiales bacterium]|nr:hypothetical protein [Thermomicrobiales bacterium]